jgi:hypothetical protein
VGLDMMDHDRHLGWVCVINELKENPGNCGRTRPQFGAPIIVAEAILVIVRDGDRAMLW